MNKPMIIDTDVLIDYLHGVEKAYRFVTSVLIQPHISVITVSELYSGVDDGEERYHLDKFLEEFSIVDISSEVSKHAGLYKRQYRKNQHVGLANTIIAATGLELKATVVSLERKRYPMCKDVLVPYRK